jgi:osmotically-inducible protein OsmY
MKLRTLIVGLTLAASAFSLSVPPVMAAARATETVDKQVRHELNMLPYVNAFDYLSYTVANDGTVTLTGAVTSPVVRSDAANVVKRVEGVERVNNQIQALPPSPMDDSLRVRLFRAIYGYPTLQKYALGVTKPIRIIVDGGRVTLMGVVDNEADKSLAGIRANMVPGIFSVDNQLKVVTS